MSLYYFRSSSKRLSDLSSVLDSDRVKQALSEAESQSGDSSIETSLKKKTDVNYIKPSPKSNQSQSNDSKSNEDCGHKMKKNTGESDSDDSSDRNGNLSVVYRFYNCLTLYQTTNSKTGPN